MEKTSDLEWAKGIVIHLTGRADDPSPMLLKMIADIKLDGFKSGIVMAEGCVQAARYGEAEGDFRSIAANIRNLMPPNDEEKVAQP